MAGPGPGSAAGLVAPTLWAAPAPGPPGRFSRENRRRARRFLTEHPTVLDAAVFGPFAAIGTAAAHGLAHPIAIALVLPLIWRRVRPMLVFGVIAAAAFAQWLVDARTIGDAALLVALYTVAARETRTQARAAAGVLLAGAVLATLRWSPPEASPRAGTFFVLLTMITAAYAVGSNIGNRRAHLAFLEGRATQLERERDQQARLAAAAERARIAREMHDVVAHNLSVMIALADGAAFALEATPERAAGAIELVSRTGREALGEMRRLLGVLRDDGSDADRAPQPGVEDLDRLLEQVRAAGLPVTLEMTGRRRSLPTGAALTVYRLVQESLTNTLKHGGPAATAVVRLVYGSTDVAVEVLDTGTGSARSPAGTASAASDGGEGRGLTGMAERVAVYGGTVDAGPRPEGGWRVAARLGAGDGDTAEREEQAS